MLHVQSKTIKLNLQNSTTANYNLPNCSVLYFTTHFSKCKYIQVWKCSNGIFWKLKDLKLNNLEFSNSELNQFKGL